MIDIDKLRKDMLNDCYGAFFVADFGGALVEASEIERASDEELIRIAQRQGIDLRNYAVQSIM